MRFTGKKTEKMEQRRKEGRNKTKEGKGIEGKRKAHHRQEGEGNDRAAQEKNRE